MRLQLSLETTVGALLPFNYEYALSSWIYKRIQMADPAFSEWLHERGYSLADSNRRYKFFTFDNIRPALYHIEPGRGLRLKSNQADLVLSFLLDEAMERFVTGLFQDQEILLSLPGKQRVSFRVVGVNMDSAPIWRPTMRFKALTPIFVAKYVEGRGQPLHLHPTQDEGYGEAIVENLRSKAASLGWSVPDAPVRWQCLTPTPKSKVRQIKGGKFKMYEYSFLLTGPEELMQVGYYGGFGSKNASLGGGLCEIL